MIVPLSRVPRRMQSSLRAFALVLLATLTTRAADLPVDWVDPTTGHRVVRLSTEPGTTSMYFNVAAYTPDGKKLIVNEPHGISVIVLATQKIERVIDGRVGVVGVGRKSGNIYYVRRGDSGAQLFVTSTADGTTRKVVDLAANESVGTINADETLAAGTTVVHATSLHPDGTLTGPQPEPAKAGLTHAQQKDLMLHRRLEAHIPMTLFTIDLKTGTRKTLLSSTDWLNHLEFSPVDPKALLFCHEGVWQEVDRLWLIQTDGTGLTKVHQRTMAMEIAGHEFWSADGKTIWYDLQTPRGEDFWLAGFEVATGHRTQYHLERNEWSVHYNISPDGTLFAGDGGDSEMVAHAPDGKWIWLFTPELRAIEGTVAGTDLNSLIAPGVFHGERLVNMAKHNYTLEPNVTFSPDMKWLIFRSNMFGPTHVFAVEIARTGPGKL